MNTPILFFDGTCGLCNKFVNFLFWIDKKGVFKVATLQGATAQKLLSAQRRSEIDTVVVLDKGQELTKSNAILRIFQQLGGAWKVAGILRIIPAFFRDWAYDIIAQNRYTVFGKWDTCRLPNREEKDRFLD